MADKYDPIRLVGKGSFGSVYLVSRRRDGAQFVLKNMQIKNVPEKEIEAYENEVRLLTELEHPGVVGHIESFIDGDKHHMCIVMGYCEGGDLGAYLKHKKGIPMRDTEILYHFVQMALALLYMHEKNILHRDLKTQNIFIKNGLIQLGDFGISKALTNSNDFAQTCIGTPYYMSPELFQNKPYNNKSDVWALGCVLYEMMTYKHAFDAQSIGALASKVMKGVFAALPATYPKAMRTLVRDMLQLDPKARPSIHQILNLSFLRKHIKTYVTAVMQAQHMYRPRDLENFKAQLRRLGMEDMLEPPPPPPQANPVPPLALGNMAAAAAPGNGVVPTARASSRAPAAAPQPSSASAAAAAQAAAKDRDRVAAAALRHKEQAARLQELQEEEAQRRSLEEKLSKLKKAHEAKQQKLVSEQQKKLVAGVRPSSALPSARGGGGSSSAAAAAAAAKSAKSMTPSGSKAVLGAGAAAAAGGVGAAGKKPPAPAGSPPISAAAAAGAKRPPSAGPSAAAAANNGAPSYRAPSSSPSHDERAIRPAASAAAAADHRSSRSALQEERARKLQHDRAEHEQALRLKEIEEMRAAEAARLAEAERLDLRRKQLELAKRKKAEVEAEKVAARERDLERARAEEIARQKKVYLAQVEAEKAELERIQLEKQWISKRLDDLAQKPVPSAGSAASAAGKRSTAAPSSSAAAPPASHARNLREDTDGLSQKDRILAEKAARRAAEEAETQARLLQGRREAHQDRLKVHNRAAGSVAPHMQSNLTGAIVASPPRPSPALHRHDSQDYEADGFDDDSNPTARSHARRGRDDTSSEDSDHDDAERSRAEGEISESDVDPEEAQEDLAQEAEAIEEAEDLLLGLTKRIQDLRTSIEVPTVFSDAQEDHEGLGWDQEVEEEEEMGDEGEVESTDETEAAANNAAAQMAAAHVTTTHASASAAPSSSAARPSASSSASTAASQSAADALPSIPESVLVRMKLLAKECAQLVGRSKFVAAFECLKTALDARPPWSRERKVEELTKILGAEKVKHWEKIDQLVFMERSSTTAN